MNTLTHRSVFGALVAILGVLGGCSGVLPPTFTAQSVRELENVDGRTRLVFVIEATNPNEDPIPLEQVSYSVAIDGEQTFSGVRSPETTLPGYSALLFELPAIVHSEALTRNGELQYQIIGSVKYHVPGALAEVLYDANIKVPEAPLKIDGSINLGQ